MIADLGKSISESVKGLFGRPATDEAIDEALKNICVSLLNSNVNPAYVLRLRENVQERIKSTTIEEKANRAKIVKRAVFEELVEMITPNAKAYEIEHGRPNVVVFVGLQGSGKTTSICKYANYYKRRGFKTGIVCADTFRAGAFDQVKQNASKIGVPFFGSVNPDPVQVAKEGVVTFKKNDFELILVDTSGRHTQENELFEEMRDLVGEIRPDNIVFVMDAGIGQSAEDQAKGFKNAVKVGGIILTKLDGAERAGGSLSSVAATGCPIEFVGTGEHMDDLEPFKARSFVSRMLGLGDVEGLLERMSQIDINQEEVAEKMTSGRFTLVDFKNIYTQIFSMGPLTKMIQMIPGMQNISIPDELKFKKIMYVFDSLSKQELGSTGGDLFSREPSRLARIAYGSGTSPEFVLEIMMNFKQMNSFMKKIMSNPMLSKMFLGGAEGMESPFLRMDE